MSKLRPLQTALAMVCATAACSVAILFFLMRYRFSGSAVTAPAAVESAAGDVILSAFSAAGDRDASAMRPGGIFGAAGCLSASVRKNERSKEKRESVAEASDAIQKGGVPSFFSRDPDTCACKV